MKSLFLIVCTLLFFGMRGFGQVEVPAHISSRLGADKSFKTYARLMTQFMDSLKQSSRSAEDLKQVERKYKKLARQLYYLEGRQNSKGEIQNVSKRNFEAINLYKQSDSGDNLLGSTHIGNWELVGPQHVSASFGNKGIGRVDRIAFHPTDASIVYAGTPSGGLWKSTTGGTLWNNVSEYIPSLGISGIVVSHAAPSTLYILTGDGDSNLGSGGFVEGSDYIRPSIGVIKSTDGGVSWKSTGLYIPGFYVGYKLIQSPTDASVLLAATSKGVYRTANGGNTWNLTSSDSARYYDIEWKPGSSSAVYASAADRIFLSTSAGLTWANVTSRLPVSISGYDRIALAVTPNQSSVLYVMACNEESQTTLNRMVFRSTDAGVNFFLKGNQTIFAPAARYYCNIAASPFNYDYAVLGNLNCSFSTDGGSSIIRSTTENDDTQPDYVHADIHELAYNPLNGTLFIGSDGGVFTSTDHGVNTFGRYFGMSATQFYHFDVDHSNSDIIVGAAQDNGIMVKDDNTSFFKNFAGGDGFDVAMPHGTNSSLLVSINTSVYRINKNFQTAPADIPATDREWYKSVMTSWFTNTYYIGSITMFRWDANGMTETNANGRWAICNSPSNSQRIYAAGGPKWNDAGTNSQRSFSRSDDNATTWTALQNNTGFPDTVSKITSIAVHPANSTKVYFTVGGYQEGQKVYYSGNSGGNWFNYSGSLPNLPVNAITVNSNGDLFIGTDIGVFYRSTTMTDWMPFFNGLPKVPVSDLEIRGTTIFASTFGLGIWKSILPGACPATINISTAQFGRVYYEGGTITASSSLINGLGTEIFIKAQTEAKLVPGFMANAATGEEFRAWASNCGANGLPAFVENNESPNAQNMLRTQNDEVVFDIPFGALVSVAAVDEGGKINSFFVIQERMLAGSHKIARPKNWPAKKLALIVDGEIKGLVNY